METQNVFDVKSVYIHWPFCPYKCSFCPFVAFSKFDRYMQEYQDALKLEILKFNQEANFKSALRTIYLGGGTPSTWPDELLLDMCGILKSKFDLSGLVEFTIEVNPGTVRQEQLALWKKSGITRLSIGVQSLNDAVLSKLNRHQKADDVRKLMVWAQGMFTSLSVDLIIGLPEISPEEWKKQVEEIMNWPIQHISMYFLSMHEGTGLYFKVQRNAVILPSDDDVVELYYWTVAKFKEHGFMQYEISSFAKPGYESQHNQAYWSRDVYKGFGVGAWSFDGKVRFQNEKKLLPYIDAQMQGCDATAYKEILTDDNVRFERIMLGLRSLKGVGIAQAIDGLQENKKQLFFEKVILLKEKGFITQEIDTIFLTPAAFSVENEVAVMLAV